MSNKDGTAEPGTGSGGSGAGTQEFAASGPVATHLRVGGGDVEVSASDRSTVTVSVTPYDGSDASRQAAENTKVRFEGNRLTVETPDVGSGWVFRRSGRVRVRLDLPTGSPLRAQVGSADVRTDGGLGDVVVHSGSGDVYVETAGNLVVHTGSGDVRSDYVEGTFQVNTGSGDVSAATVIGGVEVRVASGDIDIEDLGGPVKATSASGDINVGIARGGQVNLTSASGDIHVGVPAGTRVWLDLSTVSGSTSTNLDMTDGVAGQGSGQAAAQLTLHARTVSGDINVSRVDGSQQPRRRMASLHADDLKRKDG